MEVSTANAANDHGRIASIDMARGIVLALMALDHVRIFFANARFEPTDLESTTLGWFATRWVTHLCAPGFFFLAGISAYLMKQGGWSKAQLSRFLVLRGLWLITLEFALFGLVWSFNPGWFWFGVIWALGAAMVVLAAAIYLPNWLLAGLAVAFTLLHNLIADHLHLAGPAAALLYTADNVDLGLIGPRLVLYPLLPWAALMVIGYSTAPLWLVGGKIRDGALALAGILAISLFIVLRFVGFGASIADVGIQSAASLPLRVAAFMNVQKYPPSLQYSLVTLGIFMLIIAIVSRAALRLNLVTALRPLRCFGEVPLFFYLIHLLAIHAGAVALATLSQWPTKYLYWPGPGPNLIPPMGYGFGLAGIYLVWLTVLAAMWPLCRAYGQLKRSNKSLLMKFV